MESSILTSEEKARLLRALAEHPTSEQVVEFAAGDAPGPERAVIQRHLSTCDACQEAVDEARTQMQTFETPEGRKRMEGLRNSFLASIRPQTVQPQGDATARTEIAVDGPAALEFDVEQAEATGVVGRMAGGIVVTLENRGGGERIATLSHPGGAQPSGASIDTCVCLRDATTGDTALRFLGSTGKAVFSIQARTRGRVRLDIAPLSARLSGFVETAAAASTLPAPDAAVGDRSMQFVSPDGLLTVTAAQRVGGYLEIEAISSHVEKLQDVVVGAFFLNAVGEPVVLRDDASADIEVLIPMVSRKEGRPFGHWMRKLLLPAEAAVLDVACFPPLL